MMLAAMIRFTQVNNASHRFDAAAKAAEIVCTRCGETVTHDQMREGPVYRKACPGKAKR